MRALWRKIIPGVATAGLAVGAASLGVSVLDGSPQLLDLGAAIRVGLPAFVIGLIFFPVNEQSLSSRLGFGLQAGLAAAVSCLVHRVLWTALDASDGLPAFGIDLVGVLPVLRHPSMLWPDSPDTTLWLATSAIAAASVAGYLAQPLLKNVARLRRRSVPSALAALTAAGGRSAPVRVR